jgi:DNA polymerase III sliding clamp (beta) subunit (PCNA family)
MIVDKKVLQKALSDVGQAVMATAISPIEKAVRVTADNDGATAFAFSSNNGISIAKSFRASSDTRIDIAVEYQRLKSVVDSALGETVSITASGTFAAVESGSMRAKLNTRDVSMLPESDTRQELLLTVDASELRYAISAVMFMTGNDQTDLRGGLMLSSHILATNGQAVIGRAKMSAGFDTAYWIPASNANRISKIISGPVDVYKTAHGVKFVSDGADADTAFISLPMADYGRLFFEGGETARVNKSELVGLLGAANVFSADASSYVVLDVEGGKIQARVGDVFSASIGAETTREASLPVNGKLLADIIRRLDTERPVEIAESRNNLRVSSGSLEYVLAMMVRR